MIARPTVSPSSASCSVPAIDRFLLVRLQAYHRSMDLVGAWLRQLMTAGTAAALVPVAMVAALAVVLVGAGGFGGLGALGQLVTGPQVTPAEATVARGAGRAAAAAARSRPSRRPWPASRRSGGRRP